VQSAFVMDGAQTLFGGTGLYVQVSYIQYVSVSHQFFCSAGHPEKVLHCSVPTL
jgi:hypothetical protein